MADLLTSEELPPGFEYPRLLLRLVQLHLTSLEPWWILEGDRLRTRLRGLRQRYPERLLVPFAQRQDNDDVACWDGGTPEVVMIHDFASPGWEEDARIVDFEAWFRQAIEDFLDWD